MYCGAYTNLHRHVRSFLSIHAAILYVCDMKLSQKTEMSPELKAAWAKSSVFPIMFATVPCFHDGIYKVYYRCSAYQL